MKGLSLYDRLLGYFASDVPDPVGVPADFFLKRYADLENRVRQSILENLRLIFQARQEPESHLPTFGLPDILQIFVRSGGASEPVKESIRETIMRYEPRIDKLRISDPKIDSKNLRVELRIEATVKGFQDKEILITEFSLTGRTEIHRLETK